MTDPFVAMHLEHLRQLGRSARTMYQRNRSLILLARTLPVPLIEATPDMLAHWRAGLRCGEDTVKHYVCDIRRFYQWAAENGLREDNPAERLPMPRVSRRLPRPISEEQLFDALACAPRRIRPFLVLAGWAGLRAKEIAYLRRQHVLDTHRPPLIVIAHDATKGRRERIVPMSEFVRDELIAYGLPGSGYLFRRRDGRPGPNTPQRICILANEYLHSIGIAATLHQLRHRFATETYRARRDLRLVQELLGHNDPSSTAGYAAYLQEEAAAAVEAIPSPRRLRACS